MDEAKLTIPEVITPAEVAADAAKRLSPQAPAPKEKSENDLVPDSKNSGQ